MRPTRTLQRGLDVIEVLAREGGPVGPTRVAQLIGLDKATVGRLLYTLCDAGYARPDAGGRYVLTTKLLELASAIPLEPDLRDRARPHLLALRDATDETVHLGVREDTRVVYIDKIDATHPVRLVSAVGQTMPLHTTALGKAALAWMPREERDVLLPRLELTARTSRSIVDLRQLQAEIERTRERGYAIDDRENEEHAYCVGAPILRGAELIGMISLSGPSYRVADRAEEFGRACQQTAEAISTEQPVTQS